MATDPHRPTPGPLWQRLLWFAALWTASLLTLSAVAYGIRAMIL
ncbi:DUF2474 family protein [Aureimonas populi]|uniref:DUF2474 family protein n=1 Tax=Aureimonas populi TaxID=1701758 RepID=A0ABW5CHK5_9HYPH|nr:DUF2474 family protein [Aureimonas populi]